MLDDDRRPRDEVLAALPVFPLPNAVLLPGMVLPLNVFEPRYLELVDHVLEEGGHLGIPLLRPGFERNYDGRPELERVFGLGRLISHQRLPDGRRFIRVEGLGRVRTSSELPPRAGFRELCVELLPEHGPSDAHRLEVLKAQLERIAATLDGDDEQMVQSVLRIPDARVMLYAVTAIMPTLGFLAHGDRMSAGRPTLLELQQRCLAAADGDERVDVLIECAAGICTELGDSNRWPQRMWN
ncbi:LON peptidase substrate-binding domain-containing protein [Paraliomyxa miuraensis]|uniref:LON peptidase substrate-binding domain-containing protein n=1 Tax=Paraliomyxa miuraensis TaxID=376150 RepID=UPI00224D0E6D|nr:LON peptidase substrate-binding domain-containing protein [Paraliomyxa miuraensis]MCX4244937.1 LON peptidase substrate-binding domain-containing protein [Paraliomyxa miuraensis]